MFVKVILSAVIGYLLGSLNASLIVGKVFYKKDIVTRTGTPGQPIRSAHWERVRLLPY